MAMMVAGALTLTGLSIYLARSIRRYQRTDMLEPLYGPVQKAALLIGAGAAMMLVVIGFALAVSTFLRRSEAIQEWRRAREGS